jgi:uncharacterized repeat protein (TIGR01451 family)
MTEMMHGKPGINHVLSVRTYAGPGMAMGMTMTFLRRLLVAMGLALLALLPAAPAQAANCYYATAQGATGPANWQTYCWLDLTGYNDGTARSTAGQNMSYTLPDGTVMTFNMRVTGAGISSEAAPSWSGAAVGNTAFIGIAGQPVMYQTAGGTTTVTIRNILLTPPSGASAITSYMFVGADAESSNEGESVSFQTNGSNWVLLDQAGPTSGSTYPTVSGVNSATVTTSGVAGTVGAHIFGSATPTTVTTTLVGGGLQGAMFAVRFASIRLTQQIAGTRIEPADQFTFAIRATASGATLASGSTSGSGLGPFAAAALSSSSALPLTLQQAMAGGSSSALGQYRTRLTCTNSAPTSTPLPNAVDTSSYSFGALQFGDNVSCIFTSTPYPHLRLTKALGSGGRRFSTNQFTMRIDEGSTVIATTTTTGTGSTVANGATPLVQVAAGTAYSLYELAAGTTQLNQYTATMACTNGWTGSSTPLPTSPSATITPQMGDVIRCTITNTRRAANATLTIAKTSQPISDPVQGTTNPLLIPGGIVRYTLQVANSGSLAVDSNSVVLIDRLPANLQVGTAAAPAFVQGSPTSSLSFNAATDIRFSNAASAPASFAACTYTPVAAYDPAVRFICLNPKGAMAGSTGTPPNFSISFLARVN